MSVSVSILKEIFAQPHLPTVKYRIDNRLDKAAKNGMETTHPT
jgi:type IV secretory pathway VirD2 relaxase